MTGSSGLLAAVLLVGSVVSLSLLSLMCLRCKRKSKIIHEDVVIYDPQTFQRGGSKFAVTRSKTVTRTNQITPTTDETLEVGFLAQTVSMSPEHDYVAPIGLSVYENEKNIQRITVADETPGIYGNVFTLPLTSNDEDDYENSEFLNQEVNKQEDDEPDYVNENGGYT
ncbi:uncharacterized protein [Brachyistius frenatus]|uniref:uncharacterized protein n=1 Tax=Brachyistius frenatus TaxID=100188 RepID=UPI0037E7D755